MSAAPKKKFYSFEITETKVAEFSKRKPRFYRKMFISGFLTGVLIELLFYKTKVKEVTQTKVTMRRLHYARYLDAQASFQEEALRELGISPEPSERS